MTFETSQNKVLKTRSKYSRKIVKMNQQINKYPSNTLKSNTVYKNHLKSLLNIF